MSTQKIFFLGFVLLLFNCKSASISKQLTKDLETSFYNHQFTGLLVYNPKTNDTIFNYNADKYFTPASNVKLVTLYTALQILPDSIPAFKYTIDKDTITIQGTGDPTFLHPFFQDSTALKMARNFEKVNLVLNNLCDNKFGPGWAWEDYDAHFSPERSSFPIYGNMVSISNIDGLQSNPKVLKESIQYSTAKKSRSFNENSFYYHPQKKDTLSIPMVMDSLLIAKLWNELLPRKVFVIGNSTKKMEQVAYSISTDSLYKHMMLKSDNFLAEQLLILASSTFSDTLSSKKIRSYILNNQLKGLKQKPRWVDGSGLSRYNLFTPTSFVQILTKLYEEIPRDYRER